MPPEMKRLKQLMADLSLDKERLREIVREKLWSLRPRFLPGTGPMPGLAFKAQPGIG